MSANEPKEEWVFVLANAQMGAVPVGDIIAKFAGPVEYQKEMYSPAEISQTMSILAQAGGTEEFNTLVSTMIDYGRRWAEEYGAEHPQGPRPDLWYTNLATGAPRVDLELGFTEQSGRSSYIELYERPESYGPTMRAYADYVGMEGLELVIFLEAAARPRTGEDASPGRYLN